jgi:hypothetical protein
MLDAIAWMASMRRHARVDGAFRVLRKRRVAIGIVRCQAISERPAGHDSLLRGADPDWRADIRCRGAALVVAHCLDEPAARVVFLYSVKYPSASTIPTRRLSLSYRGTASRDRQSLRHDHARQAIVGKIVVTVPMASVEAVRWPAPRPIVEGRYTVMRCIDDHVAAAGAATAAGAYCCSFCIFAFATSLTSLARSSAANLARISAISFSFSCCFSFMLS